MGLSGGVDSSLAAVLAKKAVGRNRLLCLLLPCGSSPQDWRDSQLMVRKFNLRSRTVNIKPVYDLLCKLLPPGNKKTVGNIKSRLRMLVLYHFANRMNYLVAGTGNKSEIMVGYFTKYGDGGVDILSLAGLFKKEVRRLAKEMGVPQGIIDKPPTAGLWVGQTDEGEMGISYNQLDDILSRLEANRRQTVPAPIVAKVKRMIESSQHKRQVAAVFRP